MTARRSSSMERACAGNTSAMCSGSSQADDMQDVGVKTVLYEGESDATAEMASVFQLRLRHPRHWQRRSVKRRNGVIWLTQGSRQEQIQHRQASQHAPQAEEANLIIAEFHRPLEQAAPTRRANEGQQPFDYQHQRKGAEQQVRQADARVHASQPALSPRGRRGRSTGRRAAHCFEEFTSLVDHHQIGLGMKAGPVRIQAAIELRELRIPAE